MEVMLKHITVCVYYFDKYRQHSTFLSGLLHWVLTFLLPHLLSKPAWDHKIPELIGDVKAMMSLFLKYKGVLPSRTI